MTDDVLKNMKQREIVCKACYFEFAFLESDATETAPYRDGGPSMLFVRCPSCKNEIHCYSTVPWKKVLVDSG